MYKKFVFIFDFGFTLWELTLTWKAHGCWWIVPIVIGKRKIETDQEKQQMQLFVQNIPLWLFQGHIDLDSGLDQCTCYCWDVIDLYGAWHVMTFTLLNVKAEIKLMSRLIWMLIIFVNLLFAAVGAFHHHYPGYHLQRIIFADFFASKQLAAMFKNSVTSAFPFASFNSVIVQPIVF